MNDLKIIDNQTLKLVDYLIEQHEKTGENLDLTSDYAFGVKFYPHNKYIVTHMRGKEVEGGKGKHAPHPLIINLGKAFNLDFNYFYDPSITVADAFLSKPKSNPVQKEESVEDIFDEIESRLELYTKELQTVDKEGMKEYIEDTTGALWQIGTRMINANNADSIATKRKEMILAFDQLLLLSRKKIEISSEKISLEKHLNLLNQQMEKQDAQKQTLELKIQQLNDELRESHKSLLEAKNGETDALKQLIALKS